MNLREYLADQTILMDGAMGTYYASFEKEEQGMPEIANTTNPGRIRDIHLEYINAGARLIRTNTFAANTKMMALHPIEQKQLIVTACELAKSATHIAKRNGLKEQVFVGGSIGPIPLQSSEDEEELIKEYKRICNTMLECRLDAIIFETFDDLRIILPVIQYIRAKSDIFIMTNFALDKNGYTQTGISAQRLLHEAEAIPEIDACGFNCGIGSGHMLQILKGITLPANTHCAILPNASYPEQIHNRLVFLDNVKYFNDTMQQIKQLGVKIVGGCCGTTPSYIKEMKRRQSESPVIVVRTVEAEQALSATPIIESNPLLKRFQEGKKVVAVELDPPYGVDCEPILTCAKQLKQVDIITLADSPMGRSRVDSILMSLKLQQETGHMVMPHISCRDKNMIAMRSTLLGAHIQGIRNCLFVTGDPVPSVSRNQATGVFDYNSIQLMKFAKEMNEEQFKDQPLVYGGALNYGRGNIEKVAERMQKKIDAGASYFLTQPIYSKEGIERIATLKQIVDTKILCGIMPLVSYRNANFIKHEMTGIDVPDEIVERYTPDMSKEEAEWVGAEIANEIMEQLKDIADGYYFMLPFNRVSLMDKMKIQ